MTHFLCNKEAAEALVSAVDRVGRKAVVDLLKKFGAGKLPDITLRDVERFIRECNELQPPNPLAQKIGHLVQRWSHMTHLRDAQACGEWVLRELDAAELTVVNKAPCPLPTVPAPIAGLSATLPVKFAIGERVDTRRRNTMTVAGYEVRYILEHSPGVPFAHCWGISAETLTRAAPPPPAPVPLTVFGDAIRLGDTPFGTIVRRANCDVDYLVVSVMNGSGERHLATLQGGNVRHADQDTWVVPQRKPL